MGEDTQERGSSVSVLEAVDAIHKAIKTEKIVTYWVRTKAGGVSKPYKKSLRDFIDLHMEKKNDDRIVIDYLISDVIVGKTDIGDPDVVTVRMPDGEHVWIAGLIKDSGKYGSIASEEITRLYKKLKDTEAALAEMGEEK